MAKLLSPLKIGKLQLKNRLVLPPMATDKADTDGYITNALLDYYDEKTKGGMIQLVIVEHNYVTLQGKGSPHQASMADDGAIEGYRKLSDLIHKNGSKAAVQLNHGGAAAWDGTGFPVIAPSAVEHPWKKNSLPETLIIEQIQTIVKDFRDAAVRVQKAGFDAVEIHSAHSYLLNQFYSPLANKRTDTYGGDLEKRLRIHCEIIQAVREATGPEFTILMRLGACDYIDGGNTIEDGVKAAKIVVSAGVDILDISGGMCASANPYSKEPGYFSDSTTAIKNAVDVPVILTGGIVTAIQAEELMQKGAADLIGVGRAILDDSKWAEKEIPTLDH